jgi:RNA polymerase sigma-70 factor (ECF subfamily)
MTALPGDDLPGPPGADEAESLDQLVAAYAPYLRAIVRRQLSDRLRAKIDSVDVVQSVWVQVLRRLGEDGWRVNDHDHLRALLVTIARRRLVSRARQLGRGGETDRSADEECVDVSDARHPSPSEVAQANDLWAKMLSLTPPDHHQVLLLRRDGLPLAEIAVRTGLHEGSIRRILRRLSRELALRAEPLPPGAPEAEE